MDGGNSGEPFFRGVMAGVKWKGSCDVLLLFSFILICLFIFYWEGASAHDMVHMCHGICVQVSISFLFTSSGFKKMGSGHQAWG